MTTYIIYHKVNEVTDCPDGIGIVAASVAMLKYPGAAVIGDVYRDQSDYEERPDASLYPFQPGDTIVIVDFSFPAHWLLYWQSIGIIVVVIDHHEKKFGMLRQFASAILDASECGATLTWKHLFPELPLPDLLVHVRRRDIGADGYYDGQQPYSEAVNEGLSDWRYRHRDNKAHILDFLGRKLLENNQSFIQVLAIEGAALIEKRNTEIVQPIIENRLTRCIIRKLSGHFCPCITLDKIEARYTSQIGNSLAKAFYPEYQFVWLVTPDGRNHLRAIEGVFDTSVVAERNGGSGHPPASGFSCVNPNELSQDDLGK